MALQKTLEEFIENHLKRVKKDTEALGYSDWLNLHRKDSIKEYEDTVAKIEHEREKATSGYGKRAEALFELGLSDSGYEKYLMKSANDSAKEKINEAENALLDKTANSLQSYSDYVKELDAKEKNTYSSVVKAITRSKSLDYDYAYKTAREAGLSEKRAKEAVEEATSLLSEKIKSEIAREILKRKLTGNEAYNYSLMLGLNESDAKALSDYARAINEYIPTPQNQGAGLGNLGNLHTRK